MNKYLIKIDSAFHRDEFILRFEKVGEPQALPDYLVIETKASLEEVKQTPGVLLAELDEQAEMLEAVSQPSPPDGVCLGFLTVGVATIMMPLERM